MTILCDEPPETIPDTSMDQHEWVVQDNPQLISWLGLPVYLITINLMVDRNLFL